ncbi:MAG: hybrid sensor histidine kinase/response regulator [Desulfobacterales bacterium]|nr:hybrid sensor histidine kinase/response regulator [Desulfobacterales bacterium]MDX2511186.1 hybrid sensor histidine kinase/response regulator [Desulfobacterales bacterium]
MNTSQDKKKILLVDDEEDIRDVLRITLSDMGYQVLTAADGKTALKTFLSEMPPIVLTDIKMPAMDGIELLRCIKRENPEAEVIMITGHGDMNLAIKSLKHRATDFITKPINVDALEIALKRVEEKITTRKQLQEYTENLERLIREKIELQDNLSNLGLMVGSISHGIKGLLTGLDGGLYLLGSGLKTKDLEKIEEGGDILKMMVERIRRMVSDILFYAKERNLRREEVDILIFANDVIRVVEPKSKTLNIALIKDYNFTVKINYFDAGFVHSALINILENAIDACIKNNQKKNHKIVFSVKNDKKHLFFIISDNGIGMDIETRDNLFSLFFSSKGREGTGLGLFLSQKIIVQHGGAISVDSVVGEGSRFTIKIPILKKKPSQ